MSIQKQRTIQQADVGAKAFTDEYVVALKADMALLEAESMQLRRGILACKGKCLKALEKRP